MFSGTIVVTSNHIKKKIRGVKAGTNAATDKASAAILEKALALAPRGKTLKIVDGLRIRKLSGGDGENEPAKTNAIGVWGVKEAKFQEQGTKKMHAHPFLRPASSFGRRQLKLEAQALIARAAEAEV